ncbi:hypothetical protein CapIbe_021152 [Capra ibex]
MRAETSVSKGWRGPEAIWGEPGSESSIGMTSKGNYRAFSTPRVRGSHHHHHLQNSSSCRTATPGPAGLRSPFVSVGVCSCSSRSWQGKSRNSENRQLSLLVPLYSAP